MPETYSLYFDFETGGIEDHHPNIQLAAIAVCDQTGEEASSFEQKIQFDVAKADPKALEINHYSAIAWAKAEPEDRVCSFFTQWSKPYLSIEMESKRKPGTKYMVGKLAGHNAQTFDLPRLRRMYGAGFFPFAYQVRDTLQRAIWYFDEHPELARPATLKLSVLAEYFGIKSDGAHDALADVRMSAWVARAIRKAEQSK